MRDMTRTERLLRLARLRGDRAAVAILEKDTHQWRYVACRVSPVTETELRAAWGDR